jgi:hypothetical protein
MHFILPEFICMDQCTDAYLINKREKCGFLFRGYLYIYWCRSDKGHFERRNPRSGGFQFSAGRRGQLSNFFAEDLRAVIKF